MKKATFIIFLILTTISSIHAQFVQAWQQEYLLDRYINFVYSEFCKTDQGFLFIGEKWDDNWDLDIALARMDERGQIVELSFIVDSLSVTEPIDIIRLSNGIYLIAAYHYPNYSDLYSEKGDVLLIWLNAQGNVIGQKIYGGSHKDRIYDLLADGDGGFYWAGLTRSNDGDLDGIEVSGPDNHGKLWVTHIDSAGNILWQRLFNPGIPNTYQYYDATRLGMAADGGLIVATVSHGITEDVTINKGGSDIWVLKLSSAGVVEWQQFYGGSHHDRPQDVIQCNDGGYAVVGYTASSDGDVTVNQGDDDGWMLKLNSEGEIEWQMTKGGSELDWFVQIYQTPSNGYIVGGITRSTDGDLTSNYIEADWLVSWLLEISSSGELTWNSTGEEETWAFPDFLISEDNVFVFELVLNDDEWGSHLFTKMVKPEFIARGTVLIEDSSLCVFDTARSLGGYLVSAMDSSSNLINRYFTHSDGSYALPLHLGYNRISAEAPERLKPLYQLICPSEEGYKINTRVDSLTDSTYFHFGMKVISCPLLSVDLTSSRRRPCFKGSTHISYCNEGTEKAENVAVFLEVPEHLNLLSADREYSPAGIDIYRFDIGELEAGECGTIQISDSVDCQNSLLGRSLCSTVWITPENTCYLDLLDTSGTYDGSQLSLKTRCVDEGSNIMFIIKNTGEDMQSESEYRIFGNNELGASGTFQLLSDDSLVLIVEASAWLMRLEADQADGFPGEPVASVSMEGCSPNSSPDSVTVDVNSQPQNDEDVEQEVYCVTITGAVDPNDKLVSPSGVTDNNYVDPTALLEYTIRFQNTGTDTAFIVEIVDTLSPYLDISSFQAGTASHPYTWTLYGEDVSVIKFRFPFIELPDSNVNEPGSNGFVKYKIRPLADVDEFSEVENYADIFFNYNGRVRTNSPTITLSDTVIVREQPLNVEVLEPTFVFDRTLEREIRLYPNPTNGQIYIDGIEEDMQVFLFNHTGALVTISKGKVLDLGPYEAGIYFLHIVIENGQVGYGKVVKM